MTEEQSYEKKQQIYEAKIVLEDGTEFPFGAGVYEPKLKQTSATWENAKHMVIIQVVKLEFLPFLLSWSGLKIISHIMII